MPSGNAIRQMLDDARKRHQPSLEEGDVNVTIQQENEIETDADAADTEAGDKNVNPEGAADPTGNGVDLLEGQTDQDKKLDDVQQAAQMDEMANAVEGLESLRVLVKKLADARVPPTQATLEAIQLNIDTLRHVTGLEDVVLTLPSFESLLISHQTELSSLESQIVVSQEAIGEKIADGAKKVWEWILEKLKMLKDRILSGKDLVSAKIAALKKRFKSTNGNDRIPVTVTAMRLRSDVGGDMTDFDRLIFTMAEISTKLMDTASHPEGKTDVGQAYITYIDKQEGTGAATYNLDLTEKQINVLALQMEKLANIYYHPKVTHSLEMMMNKANSILSGQVEADALQKAAAETMKGYIQILVDVRSILISLDVKPRQVEQ